MIGFQGVPYRCLADLAVLCPSGVGGLGTFCTEEPYNQGMDRREGHRGDSVKYAGCPAQCRAFFSWLGMPLWPGPLTEPCGEILGPEVLIPHSVEAHQKQTSKQKSVSPHQVRFVAKPVENRKLWGMEAALRCGKRPGSLHPTFLLAHLGEAGEE